LETLSNTKFILLILLLAAGLRFSGITYDSLWLDESYQSLSESVGQKLPDFLSYTAADQPFLFKPGPVQSVEVLLHNFRSVDPLCPPLYAIVLNRWMAFFGESDLAIRSLSVVFSLCSIVALFVFSRRLFGEPIAVMASLLMAVSPFDIYYAQEARMYEMLMFFAICSSLSLWLLIGRVVSGGRKLLLVGAYAISVWAMINSHYTGLFIVCFQLLFAFAVIIATRNIRLGLWLALACVLAGVLWLPWVEMFRSAASLRNAAFYVARAPSWWWPPWGLFVKIPLDWISFLSGKHVYVLAIGLYLTSAFMLAVGLRKSLQRVNSYVFVLCWLILPAVLIWEFDLVENHRIIEISRYLIGTAPAAYIVAAIGLLNYSRFVAASRAAGLSRAGKLFLTAHVFFALINTAAAHTFPQREPWKEMAVVVQRECKPDELIVVSHYIDIVCLDRYLDRPQRQIGISPGLGSAEIARRLDGVRRFWLLTAQEGEGAKNMLPARYVMSKEINMEHGLHLRLYVCAQ
jgi:mannosyltransferase